MFESFFKDLRQSLRMFWQSRGFTAAAVAALALGIGANTAIFSVVNAVLLKPIPFPDPDRLVMLRTTSPQGNNGGGSPAKFQHYRQQGEVLTNVAAFNTGVVNYTGGAFPEQLRSGRVSADFFRLFGAPVLRGRTFSAEEDRPDGDKVVVLSYQVWSRRFNSDPDVVGKTISLSSNPYTVIGVLDPSVDFQELVPDPEVWIAFQFDPNTKDQGHYFRIAARLAPGVSLEQANARLKLSSTEYNEKFPKALGQNAVFEALPIREAVVSNVRSSLLVLVGAVSFVLLIACANVANLLLVRATGRRREIAVRAAIGAGRGRIMRQLLTESVVLSLAGGVLGTILGVIGIRALLTINTAGLPRIGEDGRARRRGLARPALHAGGLARHGRALRPDSGDSGLACRPRLHHEGKRRPVGHGLPPEQDAVDPRRGRGRAGADPPRRVGAPHPYGRRARASRSRLRRRQCADDADVVDADRDS